MRLLALAPVLLLLGACNQSQAPRRPSFADELRRNPSAVVEDVARIRQLRVLRPVPLRLDADAAFEAALKTKIKQDAMPGTATDTRAFYLAFNFPLPEQREPGGDPSSVVKEQVIGFYDRQDGAVHVCLSKVDASGDDTELRLLIAHEIEHALQHQNFGMPDLAKLNTDELRLAHFAVLEGDAMVAAVGYLADRKRKPLRRVLARASDMIRNESFDRLLANSPNSKSLRKAAANEREQLLFPYVQGLFFMDDLFRVGGFPLVDKAFSVPPISTEQVLHADKYLQGEPPIEVSPPAAPAKWGAIATGTLGELMTSVVLAQCMPRADAQRAARGWGGDAFTLLGNDQHQAAVLWSSAWDDEQSAQAFESAIRSNDRCIHPRLGRWEEHSISADVALERSGTHVGYVRGLPPQEASPVARALLALPRPPRAAVPPFGNLHTVPIKPKANAQKGIVQGGVYANEMLGLLVPLPPEFAVQISHEGMSLTISRQLPTLALGMLGASDEPVGQESIERSFGEIIDAFRSEHPEVQLQRIYDGRIQLPIGPGYVRVWAVEGASLRVRLILVPLCNGTGSYQIAQAWNDPESQARLDQWLSLMRLTHGNSPPVCNDLDP